MKERYASWTIGLIIILNACAFFSSSDLPTCQPACSNDFTCVEGVCQPIRCRDQSDCSSDLLCYEGRCVATCDGASPCPSRACMDGLCVATMECSQGDVRSCESACGEGVERCVEYQWTTCSVGAPEPMDRCGDGQDNDCDGISDEGCPACENEDRKGCESECGIGEQVCQEGIWSPCSIPPPDAAGICPCEEGSFEMCETPCGVGQATCNGGIFGTCLYQGEICECASGLTESCDLACGAGQRICEGGLWSTCQGPMPQDEICFNRIDDDCDQQVDENCEECTARFLNQNDYLANLPGSYQIVPMVASGLKVWLSWYGTAVPRKAYVQGVYYEDRRTMKTNRHQLPIGSVSGLGALEDGGGVAQIAIDANDRMTLSFIGENGISSTANFDPAGTVWDAQVVGDALRQQIIYRTTDLYLQRYERAQASLNPPPLRLSSRINHLGHDLVRGGGRITIVYQDDTADLNEGRVLSMVQASDDGERLLGEGGLIDPVTQTPLFVSDKPSVIFKANQLLVAYVQRAEGMDYIKTVLLSLEGEVLSGPHTLVQSTFSESPSGLDLAVYGEHRALVWYEKTPQEEMTKIKYLALDEQGRALGHVNLITQGRLRLFPQVAYLEGLPMISWVQTDVDPEFGGEFYTLRLAQFDHAPECWQP